MKGSSGGGHRSRFHLNAEKVLRKKRSPTSIGQAVKADLFGGPGTIGFRTVERRKKGWVQSSYPFGAGAIGFNKDDAANIALQLCLST